MSKHEDYEVVWSGAEPLLPERESQLDEKWADLPDMFWEKDTPNGKRRYTKQDAAYWAHWSERATGVSNIQPSGSDHQGEAADQGGRQDGGQQLKRLPDGTHDTERGA